MNFLAHLYLSGVDPLIMTGNFLGDFVKGRAALRNYDTAIVKGIELHRGIDAYTDRHAVVQQSKDRLRPTYRHYSGVIVDMFYDHFLGAYWNDYHPLSLEAFAAQAYQNLRKAAPLMPEKAKKILPYIIKGNWLVEYATISGIDRALSGMSRRTKHESKMEQASGDLKLHYHSFKDEFDLFFPDLKNWAANWLKENYSGPQHIK